MDINILFIIIGLLAVVGACVCTTQKSTIAFAFGCITIVISLALFIFLVCLPSVDEDATIASDIYDLEEMTFDYAKFNEIQALNVRDNNVYVIPAVEGKCNVVERQTIKTPVKFFIRTYRYSQKHIIYLDKDAYSRWETNGVVFKGD